MLTRMVIAVGISILTINSAFGCSAPPPVLTEAFETSTAVFVGRALDAGTSAVPATLLVDEPFKGARRGDTVAIHDFGLGNCDFPFRAGESYLVFAELNRNGKLTTRKFSGTSPLEGSAAVLRWLRGRTQPLWNTQLLGTVRHAEDPTFQRKSTPISGAPVVVSGDRRTVTAITDSEGVYQIGGLPPGEYDVSASVPGHKATSSKVKIGECCEFREITAWVDGHISGIVRNSDGIPANDTTVELTTPSPPDRYYLFRWVQTNKDGRYAFEGIPPGSYFVGVNVLPLPTLRQPYGRTGTSIKLAYEEDKAGVDILLPRPLASRSVEVRVLLPDGRPAAGARVFVAEPSGHSAPLLFSGDENGVARISWTSGTRLRVAAEAQDAARKRLAAGWQPIGAGDDPVEITIRLKQSERPQGLRR